MNMAETVTGIRTTVRAPDPSSASPLLLAQTGTMARRGRVATMVTHEGTASRPRSVVAVRPEELVDLAHLRRARDLIDRDLPEPLDVPAMARAALMSPAHSSRRFRSAYGETPYPGSTDGAGCLRG